MANLFNQFYRNLPVRIVSSDEHLHLLNREERRHIRRSQRAVMAIAALLSVAGFLGYYLPIYWSPQFFPAATLTIPGIETTVRLPWAELLWCILLTTIELVLLTLLNIAGVHEIAVATGFINAGNKIEKSEDLLQIGLEKKMTDVIQYGIDPFQGMSKWVLFLFNVVLRLKGWAGNQIVRYLTRTLLGRYAVRALLDFAGMPLYMAINAYSVHAVMREAKVVIIGRTTINLLMKRLPEIELSASEKALLYDTLQYIAVSKRDFHQNHYLLTRRMLESFQIPREQSHPLPDDYFERLERATAAVRDVCQIVILLGFILDGQISWRERWKLRRLNREGILKESHAEMRRYLRGFLNGHGVDGLVGDYLPLS
jgi:hypothetical protein